jgi:hypothetical protein
MAICSRTKRTTKKTRKTTRNNRPASFSPLMIFQDQIYSKFVLSIQNVFLSAALALSLIGGSAVAQKSSSSSFQAPSTSAQQISSSKPAKHKHTPFDDFLIRGTVFNDKALAFAGVDIRVRRVGEKKFQWQDVTNSRGDFAIRVPYDASYEVVTRAKGFLDQTKTVDAKSGLTAQNLSFQMEPARGKK